MLALSHPSYHATLEEEMVALDDNDTQNLMPSPIARKAIGCKMSVYNKLHPNGFVACLKTHLVDMGCAQTYGVAKSNTYSQWLILLLFTCSYLWQLPMHSHYISLIPRMLFGMAIFRKNYICSNHLNLLLRGSWVNITSFINLSMN